MNLKERIIQKQYNRDRVRDLRSVEMKIEAIQDFKKENGFYPTVIFFDAANIAYPVEIDLQLHLMIIGGYLGLVHQLASDHVIKHDGNITHKRG